MNRKTPLTFLVLDADRGERRRAVYGDPHKVLDGLEANDAYKAGSVAEGACGSGYSDAQRPHFLADIVSCFAGLDGEEGRRVFVVRFLPSCG